MRLLVAALDLIVYGWICIMLGQLDNPFETAALFSLFTILFIFSELVIFRWPKAGYRLFSFKRRSVETDTELAFYSKRKEIREAMEEMNKKGR